MALLVDHHRSFPAPQASPSRRERQPSLAEHGEAKVCTHTRATDADRLTEFPPVLNGPLCWDATTFCRQNCVFEMSARNIHAVASAVASFKALNLPIAMVQPDNFPLPENLVRRLRAISRKLHHGDGIAVLRGLDPAQYSDEDNAIAYCGLASHVGSLRSTNLLGMSMNHIRNAVHDLVPTDREGITLYPSKTANHSKYHADRAYGDILVMQVKAKAISGGKQRFASFYSIYNRLMETSPETLRVLAKDFVFPTLDLTTYNPEPIIFHHDGKVIIQMVYKPFEEDPSLISNVQKEAMASVEQVAKDIGIELDSQVGDIQFVNNYAILHSRDKFEDSAENNRHLLRLGIRDPENAWNVPHKYEKLFNQSFNVPLEKQNIPVTDFDPWRATATQTWDHG